ncbi:hypothetical protein CC86DRAFT_39674 [Ophiobolus disseminans]|uniref:Uncharacterized protein n=1 Tax=Ophiobolus disseminans TaxID=1469910 RepID=A0A6A6ZVT3_9PLEO|nr:hypothetical protein CC86DRAFT_39674 [Ophiobolus disseminans]
MLSKDHSRKAWVRKHEPSYWSMMFGKNKKKDHEKEKERESRSRRAEAPLSDMFPDHSQQHFPGQDEQRFSSQGPLPSHGRNLRPDEMWDHLAPGGQTEAGERPRSAPPSEFDDHGDASITGTRGSDIGAGGQPSYGHPWSPETKVYEAQRTRQN